MFSFESVLLHVFKGLVNNSKLGRGNVTRHSNAFRQFAQMVGLRQPWAIEQWRLSLTKDGVRRNPKKPSKRRLRSLDDESFCVGIG